MTTYGTRSFALLMCVLTFLCCSSVSAVAALAPSFALSPLAPASLNLVPGQASMVSFSLIANATFSGNVSLTCTGATRGIECLVSPAAMTLAQGQTIAATVAIATQGPNGNLSQSHRVDWMRTAGAISLSGVFCVLTFKRRRLFRGAWTLLLLFALGVGGSALVGCSGGSSNSTPAGTTSLVITATSGSMTQTQSLTVNVSQP